MFVLTDEYKKLLEEFNDKLIEALSEIEVANDKYV